MPPGSPSEGVGDQATEESVIAVISRFVNTASAGGDGTTNGTAGGTAAYASLSSWEANAGGSATDDYIVDCCGTAGDTTAVTVDFPTNLTTGTVTIRANASDGSGKYNGTAVISASHYRLTTTANRALDILERNATIDGLQISHTGSASYPALAALVNSGNYTIRNCRLQNAGSSGMGIQVAGNGSDTRNIYNNLVIGFGSTGIAILYSGAYSVTYNLYHNTVYGDGSAVGIQLDRDGASGGTTVINMKGNACANSGASNDINITANGAASATINQADNATEDASGQITNIVPADAWTSPGTATSSVFTVKNSSSAIYNVVNPTLISTDIVGYSRDGVNHDAGAFELQSVGGINKGGYFYRHVAGIGA